MSVEAEALFSTLRWSSWTERHSVPARGDPLPAWPPWVLPKGHAWVFKVSQHVH